MNRDQWIARVIPALAGLADFFESLKARNPELAPVLDPKIAELRAKVDAALLGNVVGIGLSELQNMLETMKLDPRFHADNLAS